MRRALLLLGGFAAIACLPAYAANWGDNFDQYAKGTLLHNVGGWYGWDNVPGAAGVVTDAQARSTPHSIEIKSGVDAVQPLSGYTSGQWVFTAYQYLPRNLSSVTYFIINNLYNHGGPYEWAIETHMNPGTGKVNDQLRDPGGTNALPIIYDRWVEIRTEIDLDTDSMKHYYDNQLLSSGKWTIRGGPVAIANLDLYANVANTAYYDDITLVPEPAACLLLALGALALRRR